MWRIILCRLIVCFSGRKGNYFVDEPYENPLRKRAPGYSKASQSSFLKGFQSLLQSKPETFSKTLWIFLALWNLEIVWNSACLQVLRLYPDFKVRELNSNLRFDASWKCWKDDEGAGFCNWYPNLLQTRLTATLTPAKLCVLLYYHHTFITN